MAKAFGDWYQSAFLMPDLRRSFAVFCGQIGVKTPECCEFAIPLSGGSGHFGRVSRIPATPVNNQDIFQTAGEAVNRLMIRTGNGRF